MDIIRAMVIVWRVRGKIIMAALHSRCEDNIFALWFLVSGANLGCRSETCCTRLAENTGCKKIAICAPSHNFVGLYLRN